jgi:protein-tyrosine phosphatase
MAQALVKAGVHTVTCTPHLRHDKGWINTRAGNVERLGNLQTLLAENRISLKVLQGSEHYLTSEFFEHVSRDEHTPYGVSRAILVEIPYSGAPPGMAQQLFHLRRQRWVPLMAHVERYASVGVDIQQLKTLHAQGYALQVNLGSFAGAYGKAIERQAWRIIEEGLCHVVAGDCHAPEDPPRLIEAGRAALERVIGKSQARVLCEDNPAALLAGKGLRDMTD